MQQKRVDLMHHILPFLPYEFCWACGAIVQLIIIIGFAQALSGRNLKQMR
ncbi:MAG: hypothetical protein H5T92_00300 [Synergistales bacterium]|nr:hypothetical protein [Synergistales bacterium]